MLEPQMADRLGNGRETSVGEARFWCTLWAADSSQGDRHQIDTNTTSGDMTKEFKDPEGE